MIPNKPEVLLELAGGAPVVIKLLEGTQGIGVWQTQNDYQNRW
jgi:glutathione synthase/RimK-type ligase-like ATP-grasp enzyme